MKYNIIKNHLCILSLCTFIFLWDLKQNFNFDFRILIIFLLPFVINKLFHDYKKKNFIFIKIFLIFIIFILIHIYQTLNDIDLNKSFFINIAFLLFLFLIAFYYTNFILENKIILIFYFLLIFFISTILSYFIILKYNEPFFCGSIKNFFLNNNVNFYIKNILFYENSHLAMSSVSIILIGFFYFFEKNFSLLIKALFVFFLIVCFFKSSTTLILGLIISSLGFVTIEYQRLTTLYRYFLFFLILFLTVTFFSDNTCRSKIIPEYDNNIYIENKFINENIKNNSKMTGSLSSAIFFHSANITRKSIFDKPLGWGFQNYEKAFEYYNNKYPPKNNLLLVYNSKDGTNNFFKIIVEFGIIGLFIYLLLIYIFLSQKISVENKLFLFPFLITQSLRGAGYFNAGFVLIFFIIVLLHFNYKK